jgi:hypothetical protein
LLAPDAEDVEHFEKLAHRYEGDMKEAKEDAESYELAVRAHEDASEWYERAQLGAEIGVVVASVALLLSSRRIWYVSLVVGALAIAIIGRTAWTRHSAMIVAEKAIEDAKQHDARMEENEGSAGTKQ